MSIRALTQEPLREGAIKVGDGAVGKTSFIMSFAKNEFPEDYLPTIVENVYTDVQYGEEKILLGVWDTAGQEEYDKIRPASYPGTDAFIVCFSIVAPDSLYNVEKRWVPEIRQHMPYVVLFITNNHRKAPIILVGTKFDLREEMLGSDCVSSEEGIRFMNKWNIAANTYIECSARTQFGLQDIFKEVVRIVRFPKDKSFGIEGTTLIEQNEKKGCCLLQ